MQDIFGFSNPVELEHFPDREICLGILEKFAEKGFRSPRINGGALRDLWLGLIPRDYDIRLYSDDLKPYAHSPDHLRLMDEGQLEPLAESFLLGDRDFSAFDLEFCVSEAGTAMYEVLYRGFLLDVLFEPEERAARAGKPSDLAMCVTEPPDAPIDAIAMGIDGRVYAHPLFEKHARHRIYCPVVTRGAAEEAESEIAYRERFEHLREHIPGLQFRWSCELDDRDRSPVLPFERAARNFVRRRAEAGSSVFFALQLKLAP